MLAALVIACAPSRGEVTPAAIDGGELAPHGFDCAPLVVAIDDAVRAPWSDSHPLFERVSAGWPVAAEEGTPVAIRDAETLWAFESHRVVHVRVAGVPHEVKPCWVATRPDWPFPEVCSPLWQLPNRASGPRTARDWATLVALDDAAAAVFVHPTELADCDSESAPSAAWSPGLRGDRSAPTLRFLERIDGPRFSTWLLVDLSHPLGSPSVRRREIATVMRGGAAGGGLPVPGWSGDWPLSDHASRAGFGLRTIRTHPLWPTPVNEACPSVAFSPVTPELDAGDTFDRVQDRITPLLDPEREDPMTAVVLAHDHLDLPGVRLVAASSIGCSCLNHWAAKHCLVADDRAWCPDGTAAELQAIVDRFALEPAALEDHQWFELAVIMTGVRTFVLEPALLSDCTRVAGARARAPSVTRTADRVRIEFTAIEDDGHGRHYHVTIETGRVRIRSHRTWASPERAQ